MVTVIDNHLPHGDMYRGKPTAENNPDRIVVHAMGEFIRDDDGTVYSAVEWLDKLKRSAHILVAPTELIRCREDNELAWHARGFNVNTLGIEFLVPGIHDYGSFRKAITTDYINEFQWGFGLHVVREWMRLYHITTIVRHSDIDPTRKVDPGTGFDFNRFISEA